MSTVNFQYLKLSNISTSFIAWIIDVHGRGLFFSKVLLNANNRLLPIVWSTDVVLGGRNIKLTLISSWHWYQVDIDIKLTLLSLLISGWAGQSPTDSAFLLWVLKVLSKLSTRSLKCSPFLQAFYWFLYHFFFFARYSFFYLIITNNDSFYLVAIVTVMPVSFTFFGPQNIFLLASGKLYSVDIDKKIQTH